MVHIHWASDAETRDHTTAQCPSCKCKMHACLWSRVISKEVDDKPMFFSDLLLINLLAVDDKPTCRGEINDQMKHRLRCECMGNYALDAWTGIKCKMTSDHEHEMLSVCAPLGAIIIIIIIIIMNQPHSHIITNKIHLFVLYEPNHTRTLFQTKCWRFNLCNK